MAGLFGGTPKVQPQVIETTPTVINNSEQTKQLEQSRKKRRGAASSFIAGNTSLSGNSVRKTTLGE
jgi:hypothetical protein